MTRNKAYFPLMILIFGICISISSQAQINSQPIEIGDQVQIYSDILGEERSLLLRLPERYYTGEENYPVLVLLDADALFHSVTAVTGSLAINLIIPEMIVVAIQNTDRSRDMSPPSEDPSELASFPTSGGAEGFLGFIRDELLPWVDENYRTRPYRALIGHSFGGLFVINTLVSDSSVFDAYIAVSPSLQWNNQGLVDQVEQFLEMTPELQASLYMTIANEGQNMEAGARKIAGYLAERAPRGFEWEFQPRPEEHHGSVVLPSVLDGLRYIFSGWYLHDAFQLYENFGIEAVNEYYRKGAARYGYERTTPEYTFGTILNYLTLQSRLDEATALMLDNQGIYPLNSYGVESIARLYLENNESLKAAELYRLALETNPGSTVSRQALDELNIDYSDLVRELQVDPSILQSYTGRYLVPPRFPIEIIVENDQFYRIFDGNRAELHALNETEFYQIGTDVRYIFNLDAQNTADSFIVRRPGVADEIAQRIE